MPFPEEPRPLLLRTAARGVMMMGPMRSIAIYCHSAPGADVVFDGFWLLGGPLRKLFGLLEPSWGGLGASERRPARRTRF